MTSVITSERLIFCAEFNPYSLKFFLALIFAAEARSRINVSDADKRVGIRRSIIISALTNKAFLKILQNYKADVLSADLYYA